MRFRPNLGTFIGGSLGANWGSLVGPRLTADGWFTLGPFVLPALVLVVGIAGQYLWILLKMDQRYLFMKPKSSAESDHASRANSSPSDAEQSST